MSQTQVERLFIADKTSITGNIWRITTGAVLASGSGDLTSNWETADSYGVGAAGESMTESSGIFTFPSTGFFLIKFGVMFNRTSNAVDYAGPRIFATQDDSSYNQLAGAYVWFENTGGIYGSTICEAIFDVTNTTTHKVKMNVTRHAEVGMQGSGSYNVTYATFMKLGDT
jgi:hypothetical protein